jgi:Ankyrin repeats (3 copies)/Protein of unknown function (DUF3592)
MKSKIGALLFSAVFMLMFGAGGFFAGIVPLWDALNTHWRAPGLVAVQATVGDVQLTRTRKGSSGVRVWYSYAWQGARYSSEQMSRQQGLTSSDNLSDWHEQWFEKLKRAQTSESTITAWIDPANPTDAVVDKEVRWAVVWFAMPFATLFTGVGLVAGYFFFATLFGWRKRDDIFSPASETVAKNAPVIHVNVGGGLFFFGVIWSLFVMPICAMVWSSSNGAIPRVLLTGMAALGLWMMVSGGLAGFRTRRSVSPTVSLSPQSPAFGQPFVVRVHFPNPNAQAMPSAIAIAIAETVIDQRGSTTSRRAGVQRSFVAKRTNRAAANAREVIYEAAVVAPPEGHASGGPKGGLVYSWTIEIGASKHHHAFSFPFSLSASSEHEAQFSKTLEIDKPTDFAQSYRELRQTDPNAIGLVLPEDVCSITRRGREWTANFSARGLTAGPTFLLLCATGLLGWCFYQLVFAPSQVFDRAAMYFFAVAFGVFLVALAMHFATRRFHVTISPSGLFAARASVLLGRTTIVPVSRLSHFSSVHKFSQTTHGQTQEGFHAVYAHEKSANLNHRVTPTLGGVGALDALVVEMNDALEDVRAFGITPAPQDEQPLYSPGRRVFAWGLLASLAALAVAASYMLLFERTRIAPALGYVGVSVMPRDLARARFVPNDIKRHDAIMDASDRGDVGSMQRLLSAGADPNTEVYHGSTLLHMAVSRGATTMVAALLDAGADVNRTVTRGEQMGGTPLSVALYFAKADLAALLVERGAKVTGLNYSGWDYANVAAFSGCIDCLELLKRNGTNLDAHAPGGRGETPIMTAAKAGKLETIRWLAENGASLSKRDPMGYNVVGWAHFFKQESAKALLLSLGADPDVGEKRSSSR